MKKIIGWILIVAGVVMLVGVIVSVGSCLPSEGPWIGKITQYRAPYPNHGLHMLFLGIAAVFSFLGGAILVSVDGR